MVDAQSADLVDCLTRSLRDTLHREQFHAVNSPWDALGALVRTFPNDASQGLESLLSSSDPKYMCKVG